jgi:hypothetical protein
VCFNVCGVIRLLISERSAAAAKAFFDVFDPVAAPLDHKIHFAGVALGAAKVPEQLPMRLDDATPL